MPATSWCSNVKPDLSIVFSCYGQPLMLREWFRAYQEQDGVSILRTEVAVGGPERRSPSNRHTGWPTSLPWRS